MRPLSKREKILLYALAVVAIVAGMVTLVIQPAMARTDTLDAAILEKQMSVDSIRSSLLTTQALKDEIAESEAGVTREGTYFLPVMTNNELDKYVTGLLQTHGLTALSLAIASAESADGGAAVIRTYQVRTSARGTMTQFMLLTDTVRELDGVRIAALTNRQDILTTPAPTATPRLGRKAPPAPLFTTPTPAPKEGTYTMDITFYVQEYAEGTSTSVTLDREE